MFILRSLAVMDSAFNAVFTPTKYFLLKAIWWLVCSRLSCLKPFSSDTQESFSRYYSAGMLLFSDACCLAEFFILLSVEVSIFSSHCLIISVYFGGYQGSRTSPGSSEVSPCTHTWPKASGGLVLILWGAAGQESSFRSTVWRQADL